MNTNLTRIICLTVYISAVTAAFFFTNQLEFNRSGVANHEFWRLLTGHFTHSSIEHLTANLAASLLVYWLLLNRMPPTTLALILLVNCLSISGYLYYYQPDLQWYTGLSGLIHALIAVGCLFAAGQRLPYYWGGVILIWLKVAIEQYQSPNGYFNEQFNLYVITSAHFAGVASGTVFGTALFFAARKRP